MNICPDLFLLSLMVYSNGRRIKHLTANLSTLGDTLEVITANQNNTDV